MGTPPEEGVGGLFGRLKAKLIGEEPLINQPVPPPPGPVPDFLQRRRAQYIYQDHPIGNDPSRYAGGPMGQQDMGECHQAFSRECLLLLLLLHHRHPLKHNMVHLLYDQI